jgi:hypothetical protein
MKESCMLSTRSSRRLSPRFVSVSFALGLAALLAIQGCGGGSTGSSFNAEAMAGLLYWNQVATDATGTDHGLSQPEQVGPCRTARAMAIVHVAIFETMIAANHGGFQTMLTPPLPPQAGPLSITAAMAQAAHDTLAALYPSQAATLQQELDFQLGLVPAGVAKTNGVALGAQAAATILAMRAADGAQTPEMSYATYAAAQGAAINAPGVWRQDPVSLLPVALGAHWDACVPFVMTSADQFRAPAPPDISSAAYATAYDEVKSLGGDDLVTPSARTADQTVAAIFWGYDAAPALCAPPRLYDQIVVHIAQQQGLSAMDLGRLLAVVNVAMADAGLACWDSKYFYKYWRPVAGIRESDPGTGPSGLGDGNAATTGDPTFSPLGAPASNTSHPNFTPPFPAYPSGHATFGGAIFQVMRNFFHTDSIPFTFVSDEFNGVTRDNTGQVRPLLPRTFSTFTQAEDENGQSRIYLGIHWRFDKTAGIAMGNSVGNWTWDHVYQPIP